MARRAAESRASAKVKLEERARRLLEESQQAVEKSNVPAVGRVASPTLEPTTRSDLGADDPRCVTSPAGGRAREALPAIQDGEDRYVFGIVLEPELVDAQDDIYSAPEIREAAHRFMEEYRNIGLMHRGLVNARVKILESYLAPTAFALEGAQGRKGTGLLAMRMLDDDLWSQLNNGELTGLSMVEALPGCQSLPKGAQAPAHELHRRRGANVAGGGRQVDRVRADPGDPACRHETRGGNDS